MCSFSRLAVAFAILCGLLISSAPAQQRLYKSRWNNLPLSSWHTDWNMNQAEATCVHRDNCNCGGKNYCRAYPGGGSALYWPNGCASKPMTINCEVQWYWASPPPQQAHKTVSIVSHAWSQDLCIDVPNSQYQQGTQLIVYPCQGSPNQLFTYTQEGWIKAGNTNLCLDAFRPGGGASQNGDVIGLWACGTGSDGRAQANQNWSLVPNSMGSMPNFFGLALALRASPCIEVIGINSQQQNGRLVLAECRASQAQAFSFR